jgi:PPOX class probable F420-dependent enzyme
MTGSNPGQTISKEKYVSVATFRKTGVAVATATWIVPLDGGRVGVLTSSASGKAKRLRNNPSVTLQPSDVRGRVKAGTTPVAGTVELVTSGPDFETITSRVKAKYGLMVPISRLMDRLRHPLTPSPLLRHRRSKTHFTTLPCPWGGSEAAVAPSRRCRRVRSARRAASPHSDGPMSASRSRAGIR